VLNRSIGGLLLLEPLTDKLLELCPVNISPNILSVLSCFPVFILSLWAYPSRICFLLATISFLLQQLFDIANKKQAIRLEQFSPLPLYVDRLCDVVSVVSSVVVVGKLLGVGHEWLWFSAWAFGVLPFYTHHLVMYYSEYMIFKPFSPET
jgi:phosphatidylglycerophosphate synthase